MAAVIQVRSDVPFVDDIVTVLVTDTGYQLACSVTGADQCALLGETIESESMEGAVVTAAVHISRHETRAGA